MGEVSCIVRKESLHKLPFWKNAVVQYNSPIEPDLWIDVPNDNLGSATFEEFLTGGAMHGYEAVMRTPHITHVRLLKIARQSHLEKDTTDNHEAD